MARQWHQEILAGLTTFVAMAYIVFLNPHILHAAGMPLGPSFTATCIVAAIASGMMALANLPFGMAPGMTLNTFFVMTLVQALGLAWEQALVVVALAGLALTGLALLGDAKRLSEVIPHQLQQATLVGIGALILTVACQRIGIGLDWSTNIHHLPNLAYTALGVIAISLLQRLKVPGSILWGMLGLSACLHWHAPLPSLTHTPPSLAPLLNHRDWLGVISQPKAWAGILSLALITLFDVTATVSGLLRTYETDESLIAAKTRHGVIITGLGSMISAYLGSSSLNPYFESALGIRTGGKTGLTAFVVAMCFLACLWLAPILTLIPAPAHATGLVIVSMGLLGQAKSLKGPIRTQLPAWVLVLSMPLFQSIGAGLALGTFVFVAQSCWQKRSFKAVSTSLWWVAGLLSSTLVMTWFL